MHILMIFRENRSDVTIRHSYTWLPLVGVASNTQPRQLGTTNILIHAPLSRLLCVLISYQDGYYTQIISLQGLIQGGGVDRVASHPPPEGG